MDDLYTNIWGWMAAAGVWVFDHWSGFAAFILFGMQFVYQVYRIKQAKKECDESED